MRNVQIYTHTTHNLNGSLTFIYLLALGLVSSAVGGEGSMDLRGVFTEGLREDL